MAVVLPDGGDGDLLKGRTVKAFRPEGFGQSPDVFIVAEIPLPAEKEEAVGLFPALGRGVTLGDGDKVRPVFHGVQVEHLKIFKEIFDEHKFTS